MSTHDCAAPLGLAADQPARRPRISLTPLIDVVFILLVFFMLASSFMDWRAIDLNPPAATGAGGGMEGAVLVELRADGLRLGGTSVARSELAEQVAERLDGRPDAPVLVRPGDGVTVQDTVSLLDILAPVAADRLSVIRGGGR